MMRNSRIFTALLLAAGLSLGACSPTSGPDLTPPETTTPAPATTTPPVETPEPTEEPTEEPTPDPVDPLGEDAYTVLLIGTDSRDPQSLGGQADTIMVAHIPEDREQVYLISFTRDSYVDIPGYGAGRLNSAYPRGGMDAMHAAMDALLGGVDIDLTVQTNFNSFINITRWLDGIEVENKHYSQVTVNSTGRVVTFEEGLIELENTDGLIYVRERKRLPMGDLDRTERQRATIIGIAAKLQERLQDPEDFIELIPMLYENVKVTGDFTVEDAFALEPMISELEREDFVSLMAPLRGFEMINGMSVNAVNEAQTKALGEAIRNDTMAEYVETYGTEYGF